MTEPPQLGDGLRDSFGLPGNTLNFYWDSFSFYRGSFSCYQGAFSHCRGGCGFSLGDALGLCRASLSFRDSLHHGLGSCSRLDLWGSLRLLRGKSSYGLRDSFCFGWDGFNRSFGTGPSFDIGGLSCCCSSLSQGFRRSLSFQGGLS